jgi:hypothetical protein
MPELNVLSNINQYVRDEIAKENIPSDARLALIGTVDNRGARIVAAVQISNTEKLKVSVASVFEHTWEGDNTAAMKVIFIGK